MSKVSIIIPIYNVEDYIIECLQSVANQTMTEGVECILVDDCGKDNSVKLALDFINAYKDKIEFKMLHHGHNRGLSAARNTGIKSAKGDYVYFLDSDDTIDAKCMELMYGCVEKHGNIDLVQGAFYENEKEHKDGSPYRLPESTDDQKIIKNFLLTFAGDVVGAQSRLVKKEMLIKNNLFFKEGIIHEDNHWTFFLAKYVHSMAFCREATYYHRFNPSSITRDVYVKKEASSYGVILEDMCNNVDDILRGRQMELILDTFMFVIDKKYYESDGGRHALEDTFRPLNNSTEWKAVKEIMALKPGGYRTKLMHALIREYKAQSCHKNIKITPPIRRLNNSYNVSRRKVI